MGCFFAEITVNVYKMRFLYGKIGIKMCFKDGKRWQLLGTNWGGFAGENVAACLVTTRLKRDR